MLKVNGRQMSTTPSRLVTSHITNNIFYCSLNDPHNMNSLTKQMVEDLSIVTNAIKRDQRILACIFRSNYPGYFCTGINLKERMGFSQDQIDMFMKNLRTFFYKISRIQVPTFSLIDGHCYGSGLELALSCDFRIATRRSLLGFTETKWGVIPGAGGTQKLPKLVGVPKAKEMILFAEKLTGERALEIGLINELVEDDEEM